MRRLLPAVTLALLLILSGCRSNSKDATQTDSSPTAAADAAVALATPSPTAVPEPIATPTPAPTPEPEPPPPPPPVATPVRLRIPRIKVDARIVPVGVTRSGEMDSPKDAWSVAWYEPGFKPGEQGNAVLAGHVDYVNVGAAVFWNLKLLQPGDRISILSADEQEHEFEVKEIERYSAAAAPVKRIFGAGARPGLNLITCGGTFNARTREYDQRLVVYTEAVVPGPPPDTPHIERVEGG